LAAGAEARQPLEERFWGQLHGQIEIRSGHRWNSRISHRDCRLGAAA
jgi:uncharacterized glyoxalase superfamily protein PhnB